jgi:HK97 family phage major capsid protein
MDELKKKLDALLGEMRTVHEKAKAEDRALTEDEQKAWDAASAKVDAVKAEIKRVQALGEVEAASAALPVAGQNRMVPGGEVAVEPERKSEPVIKRYGSLKNFTDERQAYRFGRWMSAAMGSEKSQQYCRDQGLELRVHTEGLNSGGGYLVPDEFDNALIDLRERYGVFRRNARIVPMASDTKSRKTRLTGLTTYWVGENEAITASDKSWGNVSLTAHKLGVLSYYTVELNEDAMASIGDDLAGEIAYAFALKEDECGFNGDGTQATYAGIRGVVNKLTTQGAGVNVIAASSGSDDDWAEIEMKDFSKLVGALQEFADGPGAKWYCSKAFFGTVMQNLAYAAGGNTTENIAGRGVRTFMGYPVEVTQVLPKEADTAEIVCLFGNLSLAADFGDRRQTTIAFDSSVGFTTDTIAIKGTERFDINVHSIGTTTVGGPVAAMLTAS